MIPYSNFDSRSERKGFLVLEDGSVYPGRIVGRTGEVIAGEVVFNTSLTGYQEILTDPSYAGQIVTFTAPLIGNYGACPQDDEADRPWAAGLVVRELSRRPHNWRATRSLPEYLDAHGIVCIEGVDTRRLTRQIRSEGAMRAAIGDVESGVHTLADIANAHPRMTGRDLTSTVTTPEVYDVPAAEGEARFRVAVYDFGVKRRSLQLLSQGGCDLTVYPSTTPVETVLATEPHGVFLSNGPGDPGAVPGVRTLIAALADAEIPVFGICLGHQLVARGFGGETFKLLYGHRGANHPVRNLSSGRIEITCQNHGFAVRGDGEQTPGAPDLRATHINLNDGTLEGLRHRELPIFAVQYHPEASPGPHDSRYLFGEFLTAMEERRGRLT